ncbi:MAG: RNase P modulator RnpM [Candidatus Fimousia sp.]
MLMKKVPMRQCVGCHNMVSKREMIRVIKTSDGQIMLDATGKKNGRGAYICNSRECLEKAIKSRSLERSLKAAIPSEIYDSLKEELDNIE